MIPAMASFLETEKQNKAQPHGLMKSLECSGDVGTPACSHSTPVCQPELGTSAIVHVGNFK